MDEGTKPTESAPRSHIIKRPRLTKLLDDSGARLILLVAPAGYGKTTLARQWLAAYQRPIAWYRATPASADVAAVATGLAAEIDEAIADGTRVTTDRLTSLVAIQQRPDVLARALSRSRDSWPKRLVIAIDDYHQLSSSDDAETFVGELVSLLPATFVITTRTRPTWCTPRQTVYGEAIEIGTAELTMTEDEARQVFEASSRPAQASTLNLARGWPVVIGLAARTWRGSFPSKALPWCLYEFLADELIQAVDGETRRALTILAICGTTDRALARELIGPTADAALSEAEKRGLLNFEESTRLVLHPLLAEFLITKLNEEAPTAVTETISPLVGTLVRSHRWDECLSVAEAVPEACDFASEVLESCLQELLGSGRVATIRRWLELAKGIKLTDPIVRLAEAEMALLAGEYDRAIAVGTYAAETTTSGDLRSRAELAVGRAAHLADHRMLAMRAFELAEASAAAPDVRAAALWGQVLVRHEEESADLDTALGRFAAASDGTGEHAVRLAHGRMFLEFSRGDVRRALDCAYEAGALARLSADPLANLAALNQLASMLAYVAQYEEALHAADRLMTAIEDSGSDFALGHGLLTRARALIGLRRFAHARNALRQVLARLQAHLDPWICTYLRISQARLEISLGDLCQARDYLRQRPTGRTCMAVNAEFDAHLALIEAATGNVGDAVHWIKQSRRSTSLDARALAWLAATILSFDSAVHRGRGNLGGVDRVVKSGYLDALVMACRAQPELARRIVVDGTHADTLRTVLTASEDEPLARAAGLDIPRTMRRAEGLSPRELEVYELMTQGRTNPEIARSLFISEATTKVHVRHILQKLGARSRVEAVRAWPPGVTSDSDFDDAS